MCRDRGVTGFSSVVDKCASVMETVSVVETLPATCTDILTLERLMIVCHFQEHCEYVLTKDCQHRDFQITVKNEHRHGNTLVTYVQSVAIKIPKVAIIKLLLNKVTVVNNVQLIENQLPFMIRVDETVIEIHEMRPMC